MTHGINWWGLGSQYAENPALGYYVITFGVFIWILLHYTRKPLALYLETRSAEIRLAIDNAKRARDDAQVQLKEQTARLSQLDQEIERLKTDFKQQGEIEKAKLQQLAEHTAAHIIKDAGATMDAELQKAIVGIRAEAIQLAVDLAAKKIEQRVSETVEHELQTCFVNELQRDAC